MGPNHRNHAHTRRHYLAHGISLIGIISMISAIVGCSVSPNGSGDSEAACKAFPPKEITLVVPFEPGGGYDAWARLLAPALEKSIGKDTQVKVENQPGGGGMRGVNTIYNAKPDGTKMVLSDPSYIASNQVLGNVIKDFDINKLTNYGSITSDIEVYFVAGDSEIDGLDDLKSLDVVKEATQQIQPAIVILFDKLGINVEFVLHEGTSDEILSIRRGDTTSGRGSLSSVASYINKGYIKPIANIGKGSVSDEYPAAKFMKDVDNLETVDAEEVADAALYRRVLFAPPSTPKCIQDKMETAVQTTLNDKQFVEKAKNADLVVVPNDSNETHEKIEKLMTALIDNKALLKKSLNH